MESSDNELVETENVNNNTEHCNQSNSSIESKEVIVLGDDCDVNEESAIVKSTDKCSLFESQNSSNIVINIDENSNGESQTPAGGEASDFMTVESVPIVVENDPIIEKGQLENNTLQKTVEDMEHCNTSNGIHIPTTELGETPQNSELPNSVKETENDNGNNVSFITKNQAETLQSSAVNANDNQNSSCSASVEAHSEPAQPQDTSGSLEYESMESRSNESDNLNTEVCIKEEPIDDGYEKAETQSQDMSLKGVVTVKEEPLEQNTAAVMSVAGDSTSVDIKEEPVEHSVLSEMTHRHGAIVVYSDSDDSSDSEFDASLANQRAQLVGATEDLPSDDEAKTPAVKQKSRTQGELFPEDLPDIEYLKVSPDESVELEPLGIITGIVDVLVIVKADDNLPALYDDTILFVEGRKPLGLIFETFGTVEKPFYSVRFNKPEDIGEMGIESGMKVFYAPRADNLTKYVFVAELRKMKYNDASWRDDNEVPASHRDFSDDEEERREKRRAKNKERGNPNDQTNNQQEEQANGGDGARRKKKRRGGQTQEPETDPNMPRLLPGDLTRNPFGAQGRRFNAPSSNQWPPRQQTFNTHRGSNPRPRFSQPPPRHQHSQQGSQPHQRPQGTSQQTARVNHPPPSPGPRFGSTPQWTPRLDAPQSTYMFSKHVPPPNTPSSNMQGGKPVGNLLTPLSPPHSMSNNTTQPSFPNSRQSYHPPNQSQPPFPNVRPSTSNQLPFQTSPHMPSFSSPRNQVFSGNSLPNTPVSASPINSPPRPQAGSFHTPSSQSAGQATFPPGMFDGASNSWKQGSNPPNSSAKPAWGSALVGQAQSESGLHSNMNLSRQGKFNLGHNGPSSSSNSFGQTHNQMNFDSNKMFNAPSSNLSSQTPNQRNFDSNNKTNFNPNQAINPQTSNIFEQNSHRNFNSNQAMNPPTSNLFEQNSHNRNFNTNQVTSPPTSNSFQQNFHQRNFNSSQVFPPTPTQSFGQNPNQMINNAMQSSPSSFNSFGQIPNQPNFGSNTNVQNPNTSFNPNQPPMVPGSSYLNPHNNTFGVNPNNPFPNPQMPGANPNQGPFPRTSLPPPSMFHPNIPPPNPFGGH